MASPPSRKAKPKRSAEAKATEQPPQIDQPVEKRTGRRKSASKAAVPPITVTAPMQIPPAMLQQMLQGVHGANNAPARAYISFSAEINANTTESLIAVISQKVNEGIKEIYLMMSTPGGGVMNGLNIYNFLRALPVKVITHNVGNVDSIGNAIFLAGEERYACHHSTFMFHGVGFDLPNGSRVEEKFLREKLLAILADQKRIGSIIGERTKLKGRQIGNLFKEARTKDADYARSVGIVDDVRDVSIPIGAPIFSLVFKR